MHGQVRTWSASHEITAVVLSGQNLRRTGSVALIVGTTFFAMNQLGVILAGRATAVVWLKAALTYLTPLIVSNYGVVCAPRRIDNQNIIAAGNQTDSPVMQEVSS
jgi:hypothetical protein